MNARLSMYIIYNETTNGIVDGGTIVIPKRKSYLNFAENLFSTHRLLKDCKLISKPHEKVGIETNYPGDCLDFEFENSSGVRYKGRFII